MSDPVYLQPEELMARGGTFYTIGGESWCNTPTDSYRLVPGKGYVLDNGVSFTDLED